MDGIQRSKVLDLPVSRGWTTRELLLLLVGCLVCDGWCRGIPIDVRQCWNSNI